jgi:hypothetical protein
VHLNGQGSDEPQAAGLVREDPHDARAPLELLVEALQQIGALQMLVVRQGQAVEGEGLLDAGLQRSL